MATKTEVVSWIRDLNRMVTTEEVAAQFKISREAATDHLRRAVADRDVKRVAKGRYEVRATPRPPAGNGKRNGNGASPAKAAAKTAKRPAKKRAVKKQAARPRRTPGRSTVTAPGMTVLRQLDGDRLLLEQDGQLYVASKLNI